MTDDRTVEHHISVMKTARYWTLGEEDAGEIWFVLHGYKQLARRFLRRFMPIDEPGRLIVAPEALSRFYVSPEPGRHGPSSVVGATWMTKEDRLVEIDDYVAYLDALADAYRARERSVTVLGFSQGVATATRWVVLGRVRPVKLLLWGDYTPPDVELERAKEALEGVDVALVRGGDDPAIDEGLAAEEAERLREHGIVYRTVTYDGGHDIDAATLRLLAGR